MGLIYFDDLISYIFGYIHKKLLNISVTSSGSFTILSFSHKMMLLFDFIPLFDKKGLMVGQKVIVFTSSVVDLVKVIVFTSSVVDLGCKGYRVHIMCGRSWV